MYIYIYACVDIYTSVSTCIYIITSGPLERALLRIGGRVESSMYEKPYSSTINAGCGWNTAPGSSYCLKSTSPKGPRFRAMPLCSFGASILGAVIMVLG